MEGVTIAKLLKNNDKAFADRDLLVIGPTGEQMGVLKLGPACQAAKDAKLDLVLVAETSEPPVCRIMNFGKFQYEQKKKLKDQKKNQAVQKGKEILFHLNIAEHDYNVKLNHCLEFLDEGRKLKVTVKLKGREVAHPEIGFNLINKITEDLKESGSLDVPAKLFGKSIVVTFNPKGDH